MRLFNGSSQSTRIGTKMSCEYILKSWRLFRNSVVDQHDRERWTPGRGERREGWPVIQCTILLQKFHLLWKAWKNFFNLNTRFKDHILYDNQIYTKNSSIKCLFFTLICTSLCTTVCWDRPTDTTAHIGTLKWYPALKQKIIH